MNLRPFALPLTVTVICLAGCGGSDDATAPTLNATSCAALGGRSIGGATISTGVIVPAAAASGAAPSVPEYCKVTALIVPALKFEVRLPTSWNGKLHYSGGGGFNGSIPSADLNALNLGYVDASSDSGHQGSSLDGSFASDPAKLDLFAKLSVPTVATAAKLITQAAYGTSPSRSYYEGCSNGGREGLMTALRFPTMFDGVIAKAPAKFTSAIESYKRTATLLANVPGSTLNAAKLALVDSSLLAACDNKDGVADGLVSNVTACQFSISALRCPSGSDEGNSCLSDPQINVVTSLTTPMVGGAGTPYVTSFPAYPVWGGNIGISGSWGAWLIGNPKSTIVGLFASSLVPNLLGGPAGANWYDYDFVANAAIVKARADAIDVTDPNMVPFQSTGGKLLMWNGTSDPAVSAQGTVEYYDKVVAAVGGKAAADGFARMYLAPGVLHCGGGTGADSTAAMLPALDTWVTAGTAPSILTASKLNATTGATVLSRPLCPHPMYARYNGTGDVNSATSFTCTSP